MLKQSEAIVLRYYPMRESDLLITLFSRLEGKMRGVARAAMKSRKRFGGALEPLSYVQVYYENRNGHDLSRLDSCDILQSPLSNLVDYPRTVALEYVAEALDQLLPDREPHDDIFRLALAVLQNLRSDCIWMPLTYFDLWIVRLIGLLPELNSCLKCGVGFGEGRAYFHALSDGLMCVSHKQLASSDMSIESRKIASEMFRLPLDAFLGDPWPHKKAADLRKFLGQRIERHIEKKLVTASMLQRLQ